MLGRRQIREKIVECLYSYYQNPVKFDVLEKRLFFDIEKLYQLYIYQLNFLVTIKQLAERQIEIGKTKFIKSEEELNPNRRFVDNQALVLLEENGERLSFTSSHQHLKWDINDDLIVRTFQRIKASRRYQNYMAQKETCFLEDQKFLGKLFLRYVAENDDFHSHLEEQEMSWTDGFHIANSMVQKTIGFMKEAEQSHTLIKALKDKSDADFALKLIRMSVNHIEENENKISERLLNWDFERVSVIDKVILLVAIAELDHFPLTASRIIINEYVEISKVYATDKSNIFINGILDKYIKDINRI